MNRRVLKDCEEFLFRFEDWQAKYAHLPQEVQDQCRDIWVDLVFQAELEGWQFEPPESTADQLMPNPCAEIALGTPEQCSPFLPEWWANETLAELHKNMSAALALNIDKMIVGKKP